MFPWNPWRPWTKCIIILGSGQTVLAVESRVQGFSSPSLCSSRVGILRPSCEHCACDCLAFGGTGGPLGCMSGTALLKIQRTSVASPAALLRLSDTSWLLRLICVLFLTEPSGHVSKAWGFRRVSHCRSVECGTYVDGERTSDVGSGVLVSCLALIY